MKDIEARKIALDNGKVKKPSTEGLIDGREICLYKNSSKFDKNYPLQVNDTATGT